jgi:hypothetical protein
MSAVMTREPVADEKLKKELIGEYTAALDRCLPIIDADAAGIETEIKKRADIARSYIDIWERRQRDENQKIAKKRRSQIISTDIEHKRPHFSQVCLHDSIFYSLRCIRKPIRFYLIQKSHSFVFLFRSPLLESITAHDNQVTTPSAISSLDLQYFWFHQRGYICVVIAMFFGDGGWMCVRMCTKSERKSYCLQRGFFRFTDNVFVGAIEDTTSLENIAG